MRKALIPFTGVEKGGTGDMNVLFVTPTDYDRAWNNREHNFARHLAGRGHHVTVVYKKMNRSKSLLDLLRDSCTMRVTIVDQPNVRKVAVNPFFNYYAGYRAESEWRTKQEGQFSWRHAFVRLFAWLAVLRDVFVVPCLVLAVLRQGRRYQVGIGFGPWGSATVWVLKQVGRIGMCVYEDRDFEPGLMPDRLRRGYTEWLERVLVRRADLVVSIGYRLAKRRQSQGRQDVEIIPTGVDWHRFQEAAEEPGIRPHALVYVGNLVSWSGVELVIQALPVIVRTCPRATLLIIGDGLPAYVAYLRGMADHHGVKDRVTFLGPQPHSALPTLLKQGRVGLANSLPVPYRQYAYPLKVIEYMAAGLPVIATQETEAAEILQRGQCGIAVPYELEGFAQAAIALLTDSALYEMCRANAVRESAGMTWERLLDRELSLIVDRYQHVAKPMAKEPLLNPR